MFSALQQGADHGPTDHQSEHHIFGFGVHGRTRNFTTSRRLGFLGFCKASFRIIAHPTRSTHDRSDSQDQRREDSMALTKTIVEPSWEAKYSYSPAVVTEGGKTVWLAGHVGFVDDAGASLAGNFDAQARQAFKNVERTLQRAGGTLTNIVWMTVSISDGRYSQRFTDIRKEIYGKDFPASTLLTAAAFAVPEIMVEITAIAVVAA